MLPASVSASSPLRARRRSCSATGTPSCSTAPRSSPPRSSRFATEIRHLARTEVGEVEEPFGRRQKGSSAMPHKRNPITAERLCGIARVVRGNALVGLENVALWHERDISHSSAERIVIPDSFLAVDYMLDRFDVARRGPRRPRAPHARERRGELRARLQPAAPTRARRLRPRPGRGLPPRAAERVAGATPSNEGRQRRADGDAGHGERAEAHVLDVERAAVLVPLARSVELVGAARGAVGHHLPVGLERGGGLCRRAARVLPWSPRTSATANSREQSSLQPTYLTLRWTCWIRSGKWAPVRLAASASLEEYWTMPKNATPPRRP